MREHSGCQSRPSRCNSQRCAVGGQRGPATWQEESRHLLRCAAWFRVRLVFETRVEQNPIVTGLAAERYPFIGVSRLGRLLRCGVNEVSARTKPLCKQASRE